MSVGLDSAPFVARPLAPARLWIRFAPRRWPGPAGPWTDLAAAGLGRSSVDASLPAAEAIGPEVDDVVYLPPVRPELEAERRRLATALAARGLPVLMQVAPGGVAANRETPIGVVTVVDLLPWLLDAVGHEPWSDGASDPQQAGPATDRDATPRTLAELAAPTPAGVIVVWPLLGGLGDEPATWTAGIERLRAAGAERIFPLPLELAPPERRALVERTGGHAFERLFHAPAPDERRFARLVAAAGGSPFVARPAAPPPLRSPRNREVAALLAATADLWLRVGRSEARGLALWRAARQAEEAPWELAALARDGQLPVLDWLDEAGRALVASWASGEESALLAELQRDYLGGGSAA